MATTNHSHNLDPIFNIPITLLKVRPSTQKVVVEMGVEYLGEMDFYLSLVKPATAIVTKVGYQHSQFLGNLERIAAEKSKLVEQLPADGVAILNWDDPLVRKMAEQTKAEVVYFGMDGKHCHIWASKLAIDNYQTKFELNYGVERVEVVMKLLGKHYVTSALAAAALGLSCGMSLLAIKAGLEKVEAGEHRLQLVSGQNGTLVLDDTYNNPPNGLEAALDVLNELPARRRIIALGEMRELGEYSKPLHEQIARKIFANRLDLVLLGQGDTSYLAEELQRLGFPAERLETGLSNSQMISKILKVGGKGDIILVKGARATRLDEVVKRISRQR